VERTCARLERKGLRLVGGIRAGSEGARIAFLHPKDAGGVLIELREAPGGSSVEPKEKNR
jgi:catechol 2,3-dioxygenase-like lactoylglutathione lyase family enzyme